MKRSASPRFARIALAAVACLAAGAAQAQDKPVELRFARGALLR